MHLVRVTHDKANYFRPAPPGTQSVEVEVFNAAAKVKGVSSEADVMRIQTDESGKALRVVENFFVKNESNPPLTQFSDRPFEFYLPEGAVVEGSAALAPGGMPVQASPVPLGDAESLCVYLSDPAGRDAVSDYVPAALQRELEVCSAGDDADRHDCDHDAEEHDVQAGAVGAVYAGDGGDDGADVCGAECRSRRRRWTLRFRERGRCLGIRGLRPLQRVVERRRMLRRRAGAGGAATSAASDTRPGGGLGTPLDPEGTNDPWAKYKWWILGGLGLVMAVGAGIMLKNGPAQTVAPAVAGDARVAAGG